MKILSPLDKSEEVESLVKAGADEFYCGIITEEWNKKFTPIASMNRREWLSNNFKNFEDLEKAVEIAHSHKKPVFLAVNAQFYTEKQYDLLLKNIRKAIDIGIDAFIVADPALILTLKKLGIKKDIHMSTGAVTLNSETAKFYSELGATRIILPRHLAINEINDIVKNTPQIQFEVFIFNEGCFNLDGFCTFHHGFGSKEWKERVLACSIPYNVKILTKTTPAKERTIKHRIKNLTRNLLINCGACALYDFNKINIHSVKIIGRGNPTKKKIKDITFFRELLNHLKNCNDKETFQLKAKSLYEQFYSNKCTYRNCYY